MAKSMHIAARSAALAVEADVRALVVVVGLLISGLVLILSTGAAWLHVT
jgi:hypothetical protein